MRPFRFLDEKGLILSVNERRLKASRFSQVNDPLERRYNVVGMSDGTEALVEEAIDRCLAEWDKRAGLICWIYRMPDHSRPPRQNIITGRNTVTMEGYPPVIVGAG